jgi:hypothetical protein
VERLEDHHVRLVPALEHDDPVSQPAVGHGEFEDVAGLEANGPLSFGPFAHSGFSTGS